MKLNGVTIRRSSIEVPPMNEHKWEKVPTIPADVFLADMEDSVPPNLKEKARLKILELVKDPSYFGNREFRCRPNNLYSPWGREDIEALAEARAPYILYPKVRTVEEIREVKRIFDRHGSTPEIMLIIETPQAVLHLEEIAACPGVGGLLFGPGDLAMETGTSLTWGRNVFTEGFLYARTKTLTTARAYGLEASEGLFLTDLKDLDAVRQGAEFSRALGFTGNSCFYPPHVPIINDVFTPKPEEVQWAKRAVEAYDDGLARGLAAVSVDGRWMTIHQYTIARRTLQIAKAFALV